MADIFTYIPAKGYTKTPSVALRQISFGDGYSQRAPKGINNITYTWSVTFVNRPYAEANAIEDFFIDKGGWAHFLWTPPDEVVQYKVICRNWGSTITSPISKTITATFTQVFDP